MSETHEEASCSLAVSDGESDEPGMVPGTGAIGQRVNSPRRRFPVGRRSMWLAGDGCGPR